MGIGIIARGTSLSRGFLFLIVSLVGFFGSGAFASTHLLLVGGGDLPYLASSRFAELAGGNNGNVLVIGWATDSPADSSDWFGACLNSTPGTKGTPKVTQSLTATQARLSKADLITQIKSATAIFFSGGDQAGIMDLLGDPTFSDVQDLLRTQYERGIPFGGTSAGMAIMSSDMFTGNEDPTIINPTQTGLFRPGLGLLPGVMVDTHFLIRQRENRFFSYLQGHNVALGMGIDQSNAVMVTDNEIAEVIGNKLVMVADTVEHPGDFLVKLLNPGDTFDLVRRRKISEGALPTVAVCPDLSHSGT